MDKGKLTTHTTIWGDEIPVIEHEEQIMTQHGMMTRRQLAALNKDKREHPEKYAPPAEPARTRKYCPLHKGSLNRSVCMEENCARYDNGRCTALACTPCHKGVCPHNNETCCNDMCAAYQKGETEE